MGRQILYSFLLFLFSFLSMLWTLQFKDHLMTYNPTYFQHIQPLLNRSCLPCHSKSGIAHYLPLDSFEDAKRVRRKASNWANLNLMPPWRANNSLHRFLNDITLTKQEKRDLSLWAKSPIKGLSENKVPPIVSAPIDPSNTLRLRLEKEVEISPGKSVNLFIYLKNPNYGQTQFFIKDLAPEKLSPFVHHLIVYTIPRSEGKEVLDEYNRRNKKGIVYGEFPVLNRNIQPIFISSLALPSENMGIKIPKDHDFIIDIHYETIFSTTAIRDQAELIFQVSKQVEKEVFAPTIGVPWEQINLPVGKKKVLVSTKSSLMDLLKENKLDFSPLTSIQKFTVLGYSPHMHNLGTNLSIYRGPFNLLEFSTLNWDTIFSYTYWLENPYIVDQDEIFTLSCLYDTSENNPHSKFISDKTRIVQGGPTTNDEMCNAIIFLSPDSKSLPLSSSRN